MNFKSVKNVEALKPGACKKKAACDAPVLGGQRVAAATAFLPSDPSTGLTLLGALGGRGGSVILGINLSPASVVWHGYVYLLARGVTAAVDTGDGNCIDASIAVACPLGSQ